LAQTTVIKNIGFVNAACNPNSTYNWYGGIAHRSEGTIDNCYMDVTIADAAPHTPQTLLRRMTECKSIFKTK